MAYSAIANSEIDTDSPITTGLMTKIRDNNVSMKDGTGIDNNAILERHIASGAIHQSQLDTAIDNADISNSVPSSTTASDNFLLTEPDYTIGFTFSGSGSSLTSDHFISVEYSGTKYGNDSDFGTKNRYIETKRSNLTGSSKTIGIDTDIRYINASPPYDLGDGQIPLFSFLRLDSDSKVIAVHNSVNPPWAHNGPTKTKHNAIREGKKVYIEKCLNDDGEIELIETEITQAVKNADMDTIPHPFLLKPGDSVVLLDPVETLYLEELRQTGERISRLIFDDYLRLDGEEITRNCPTGVMPRKFKWKNTRARAGERKSDKRLGRGRFARRNRN